MNIENHFQAVTEHLSITNNEVKILDLLVDSNNLFYDYSKNKVVSFIDERDFHLVLYNSQDNDRGFTMYSVENFCENEADLVLLRNIFATAIAQGFNSYLMRMSKSKVEDIFYMTDTFRALFNKPKPTDDYDITYPKLPSSMIH